MGAAMEAMCSPVFVPPVKEIKGIFLCDTMAFPTFPPKPVSYTHLAEAMVYGPQATEEPPGQKN